MLHRVREPALTRLSHVIALTGALAAALLVSGCGRKGPLDPPPGGWEIAPGTTSTPVTNRPAQPAFDEEGKPIAPTGPKRKTPADWLID
jgi:predicted small lipoprotein YifL